VKYFLGKLMTTYPMAGVSGKWVECEQGLEAEFCRGVENCQKKRTDSYLSVARCVGRTIYLLPKSFEVSPNESEKFLPGIGHINQVLMPSFPSESL